ncbi:MAG: XRE family transcriptional regulator [Gemmatimonadaceae bacterium]
MIDDSIVALKRQLADEILAVHNQTHMFVAAMGFGIGAPRLSDLRRGRLSRFSVERLIRLLAIVDRRVDLTIVTVGPEQVRWGALIAANRRRRSAAKVSATGANSVVL